MNPRHIVFGVDVEKHGRRYRPRPCSSRLLCRYASSSSRSIIRAAAAARQQHSLKTLSVQLKELEADGLIDRHEYPQIPPKVEYSLSEKGRSLYPVMEAMCYWGEEHRASN